MSPFFRAAALFPAGASGIVPEMDINLAVLNIGNSRLATGVFIAGKLEQVRRIALSAGNDWQGAIAEAWRQLEGTKQPAVVAASVNPLLVGPVETSSAVVLISMPRKCRVAQRSSILATMR